MKDEKAEFAARLRAALQAANIEASASVLEKRFNSRYGGAPVTAQAISQWLNGKVIPRQDKIRVLAAIVGIDPQVLQYGSGKSKVSEARVGWAESMSPQDRAMVVAYLALPVWQRTFVRDLVELLTAAAGGR
jgi:transcriptional regulator with XRE-family HTH domain